jgi:hypothetical protein
VHIALKDPRRITAYLVVLQVRARVLSGDVLARRGGHVAAFEGVVVQRITGVLPFDWLRPTDAFSATEGRWVSNRHN